MPRIYISDAIDSFWGVSSQSIQSQIESIRNKQEPLEIVINSPGGQVYEGLAIYHAIKSYPGPKTTIVAGIAASIASVIMLAGDKIKMARGSFSMIHNPWVMRASGGAKDLRKTADRLDQLGEAIMGIYSSRTKKDKDELMKMMDAETYMSDEDTKKHGFADEVVDSYGPENSMPFAAFAMADPAAISKHIQSFANKVSEEKISDDQKKSILDSITQTKSTGSAVEGADNMEITVAMVLEKAPEVAEHFRNEGKKSVVVTAEMVPDAVASALKDEGAKAVDIEKVKAESATAERARITAIQELAVAGCEEIVSKAIAEGKQPAEVAVEIIAHAKKNGSEVLAGLKAAEATTKQVPTTPSAGGAGNASEEAKVKAQVEADVAEARKLGLIQ